MLKIQDGVNLEGKKIILRADLDVPVIDGLLHDDLRLKAGLETIEFLLKKNASIRIVGHLGRPEAGIHDQKLSLLPIANWYKDKFGSELQETSLGKFKGWQILPNLFLLENIRFFKEEKENDLNFAKELAALADIYVNDAFSVSHRSHASVAGVPRLLPHFAGFEVQKEVKNLSKALESPVRPLTVVIGGAKIETKMPLVSKMYELADYILVGGIIAKQVDVLERTKEKIEKKNAHVIVAHLEDDLEDITEASLNHFFQIIEKSKTIIWNGPLGFLEKGKSNSTLLTAQAIINSGSYSIVGGGDTLAFLNDQNLLDKFGFVSMGGGAMLEFLAGQRLPGIEALKS